MAIIVGTNSYVTLETADSYFVDRLFSESWAAYEETERINALTSATMVMDALCLWDYDLTDEDQALAFPRGGEEDVPIQIQHSQMEIAFEMLTQGVMTSVASTRKLKQMKADDVLFSFYESLTTPLTIVNDFTKSMLRQFGMCNFGDVTIQTPKLVR